MGVLLIALRCGTDDVGGVQAYVLLEVHISGQSIKKRRT
jgi:hypothetical protein